MQHLSAGCGSKHHLEQLLGGERPDLPCCVQREKGALIRWEGARATTALVWVQV